jgi:hypothetical protein
MYMDTQTALWVCLETFLRRLYRPLRSYIYLYWRELETFWEGYIDLYGLIYVSIEESLGVAYGRVI